MSSGPATLWAAMARSGSALSPAAQALAVEVAVAAGDEDSLVAIISRPDSAECLQGRFAAMGAARLRTAYLSHPRRSRAELAEAVAGERRITVLAGVAGSEAAPPGLLEVLASSPHTKVAVAVAANPRTPHEARYLALVTLAGAVRTARPEAAWKALDRLGRLAAAARPLHDRLARCAEMPREALAKLASSPRLSAEAQMQLFERFVVTDLADAALAPGLRSCEPGVDPMLRAATWMRALGSNRALCPAVVARIEAASAGLTPYLRGEIAAALATAAAEPERGPDALEVACSSTEPEELAALVREVGRNVALAEALAANPHTPETALLAMLARGSGVVVRGHVVEAMLDVRPWHSPALAVAAALCHPTLLERLGGPGLGRRAFIDPDPAVAARLVVAALGPERGGPGRAVMAALVHADAFDADGLSELAWWVLEDHAPVLGTVAVAHLDALMVARLGDDPRRWEAVAAVGDGFSGSVAELLDTCALMVGPPRTN